jgi:NAD(P)-dependent dehydrogenase (short-subunit alcohol dehydrogenase family)
LTLLYNQTIKLNYLLNMTARFHTAMAKFFADSAHAGEATKLVHRTVYPAIDPTRPVLSAAGKTVLISGGATGIGFEISNNFAMAGAATIALLGRRENILSAASAKLAQAHPKTKFLTFAADITDEVYIQAVYASLRLSATSGDIDILITSAAYAGTQTGILDRPVEELRTAFNTNVIGNYILARAFLATPGIENEGKILIDVSSASAHLLIPQVAISGATKTAYTLLARHIAQEYPEVRVHSMHPGWIFSDNVKSIGVPEDAMVWDDAKLPGAFAVWLASPEAAFLNGRYVKATWDVEELIAQTERWEDPEVGTFALKVAN